MFVAQRSPHLFFNQTLHTEPGRWLSTLDAGGFWHQIACHECNRARGSGGAFSCSYGFDPCFGRRPEVIDVREFDSRPENLVNPSLLGYFFSSPASYGKLAHVATAL